MEMKRKTYAQPWLQVVRLQVHNQLLAGSGEGSFSDYETVNEGDSGGWTD